jgi:hypothetical protein
LLLLVVGAALLLVGRWASPGRAGRQVART